MYLLKVAIKRSQVYGVMDMKEIMLINRCFSYDTRICTGIIILFAVYGIAACGEGVGANGSFEITIAAEPSEGGNPSGAGRYPDGHSLIVSAKSNSGFGFDGWYEHDNLVSDKADFGFIVTRDAELTARYSPSTQTHHVVLSAEPPSGGNPSGGGSFYHGQRTDIMANPSSGYSFSGWFRADGSPFSENEVHSFSVVSDINLVANFSYTDDNGDTPGQDLYTINLIPEPSSGGTPTGGGTYNHGDTVTLQAGTNTGYTFSGWYENDLLVTDSSPYVFSVFADRTLTAKYDAQGCTAVCTPNETRCSGNNVEMCSTDGCRWDVTENCSCGCTAGTCVSSVCSPAETQCNGDNLERCSTDGCSWVFEESCACGCSGGICSSEICTPNEARCSGNNVELCSIDGCAWNFSHSCPDGTECLNGDCEFSGGVSRIAGSNRYATAVAVSQEGWPNGASTVILVRGDETVESSPGAPVDASAGAPLAYEMNAPVLITPSSSLHSLTQSEIQRLGASRVIILGGTAAISSSVQNSLQNMGLQVERIAGANRFETAALIGTRLRNESGGGPLGTAFIVNSHSYTDALAVAPHAARQGFPILLVHGTNTPISTHTQNAISSLGISNVVVVGGTAAISNNVYNAIPVNSRIRVSGANRYATAVQLNSRYLPSGTQEIFITEGREFVDAMSGAVLAAKRNSGLLMVNNNDTAPPAEVQTYYTGRSFPIVIILGGPAMINTSIENWFVQNLP